MKRPRSILKARRFSAFLAMVAPLILLLVGIQAFEAPAQSSKQNGIAYVAYQSGAYSQPDADLALSNLASTGANWISLLVTGYQNTITSTTIYTTADTPTDADLIHVITKAHSLGLKVMLKPHLGITSDSTIWQGLIGQGFTETQWTAWFASYQNFINHYTLLAQAHGVDQFCIGTELSTTQNRANNWRAVITGVRSRYKGPITYAANWGDETGISWWDAVDYIGVDAYYELTTKNNPTLAELKAAWQPYSATLATLAFTWNKLILFSEIGYRSMDGANKQPWNWQITETIDLQEQADAYQAVFESVYDQPWFAGMFWWSWSTYVHEGGSCENGYSPHDKPAEEVLRTWYRGLPSLLQAYRYLENGTLEPGGWKRVRIPDDRLPHAK